jgi:hypothetical protein
VLVDLKCGHSLLVHVHQPLTVIDEDGRLAWRAAGELRPGDYVLMDLGHTFEAWCRLPLVELQPAPPPSPRSGIRLRLPRWLDIRLAEVMGAFAGNGWLNDGALGLEINTKDQDLVNRLKNELEQLGVRVSVRQKGGCIRLRVSCKRACDWLKANDCHKEGADPGSASAHLPEGVLRSPCAVVAAWLASYFATDGCVRRTQSGALTITAYTVSDRLASELATVLRHFGIRVTVRKRPPRQPLGRRPLYDIRVADLRSAAVFGQRIGVLCERKHAPLLDRPEPKFTAHYSMTHPALLDDLHQCSRGLDRNTRREIGSRRRAGAFNLDWLRHFVKKHCQLESSKAAKLLIDGVGYEEVQAVTPVGDQEWITPVTATGEPVFANAFAVVTMRLD